jgi:hypothetical protein
VNQLFKPLLISLSALASTSLWAANLINPVIESGTWGILPEVIYSNTSSDEYGEEDITLDGSEGRTLNGKLNYTIDESAHKEGYTFSIEVMGNECLISGTDENNQLSGNGLGPNIYKVHMDSSEVENGALVCSIRTTFEGKNPNYQTKLNLEHYQYFNLGESLCSSSGTSYVSSSEGIPFTIYNDKTKEDEHFFAATFSTGNNCSDGKPQKVKDGVAIYKWDDSEKKFNEYSFISQDGAFYLEFLENDIGEQGKYLIVGGLDEVILWRYKDGVFIKEPDANAIHDPSGVIWDIEYFTSGDREFLLTVSMHIDPNLAMTRLYEWDDVNSKFITDADKVQKIPTKHAASATHYNIDGMDYVAIAQVSTPTSPIYYIDPENAAEPMQLLQNNVNTYGAKHWEHFTADANDYLLVANTLEESAVRKWEGQLVDHGDKVMVEDIDSWKSISLDRENYFITGSFYQSPEIYYWCSDDAISANHWCANLEGGHNLRYISTGVETPDMNVTTLRTMQWESMEIDGKLYLFRMDDSGTAKGEGVQVFEASIR